MEATIFWYANSADRIRVHDNDGGAAASRRTINITTGLDFGASAALLPEDLLLPPAAFSSFTPYGLLVRCQASRRRIVGRRSNTRTQRP